MPQSFTELEDSQWLHIKLYYATLSAPIGLREMLVEASLLLTGLLCKLQVILSDNSTVLVYFIE